MSYSAVLQIRPFRNLWLGQSISQLGDAFYYVVFMFMVKRVTGSDAMVGYVGALETLPYLILGPYAGAIADRLDRRKIMLASDLVSALALVLFTAVLLGIASPPAGLIMAMAFTLSCARCFFMPAMSASIPSLVPEESVLQANALSNTTRSLMPLIGLGLSAGVLSALYALSPTFFFQASVFINAISFAGSAIYVAKLPSLVPERTDVEKHPISEFADGLRYVRGRHELVILIALLTVFRLSVAPFFVFYVAANDQWFGGKPQTLIWCEFAFFVGMVAMSLVAGKLNVIRPGLWFSWGLFVVGASVGAMAFSPSFWHFCVWNLIAGLAVPLADVPINTYMQLSVPDAFRGRVNAVSNMIATGVMPIGLVLGGFLAQKLGLVVGFLAMGIGMMAGCAVGLLDAKFRAIRMPTVAATSTNNAEQAQAT